MRKLLSFKQMAFGWAFIVGLATLMGIGGSLGHARQVADIRDRVTVTKDVEYAKAGEVRLRLDVYTPKISRDNPRPCIVWIHGGGWQNGNKSSGAARVGKFAATGDYVGASVGYRLTDVASWPAQIHDCKAAIRYIRSNAKELGIDPNKIGVWGASAGGHLVSMLGTSGDIKELEGTLGTTGVSSRVSCVVDFCGPSDFLRFADATKINDPSNSVYKLLGGPMKDNLDLAKQASPATFVSKDDPPFLVVHGTEDKLVPLDQAVSFHELQVKLGMNSTLMKVEGGGHAIVGEKVDRRVKAFFDKELLGRKVDAPDE